MNAMMNELPKLIRMAKECDEAYIEVQDWNNVATNNIVVFKERFTPDVVNTFGKFIKEYDRKIDNIIAKTVDGVFIFTVFISIDEENRRKR